MPHSITYHARENVITITHQGEFDATMTRQLISEVISLVKEHDCFHIVEDFREARIRFSTMDLHDLPKLVQERLSASGLNAYQFKRALIAAQDIADFAFFETVSQNRDQNVRVFRDVEEAKKWLAGM